MKVICVGGGPAGLYFSICLKKKNPLIDISIFERNAIDHTSGWGIIFPEKIIEKMMKNDLQSALQIKNSLISWDHINIYFKEANIDLAGYTFSAMGRLELLKILQTRAQELGVNLKFNCEIDPSDDILSEADLIIASDGVNSRIRDFFLDKFQINISQRPNKYKWLGTTKQFKNAFTFIFEKTSCGWVWAHCYQFDASTSTFIIECNEETWLQLGFNVLNEEQTLTKCEHIFKKHLNNHRLMSNIRTGMSSSWLNFSFVKCKNWYYRNIVLIGDSAHTAHFSIGSGTRLALEDAINLSEIVSSMGISEVSLQKYQVLSNEKSSHLVNSAVYSMNWFEHIENQTHLNDFQFGYSLLARARVMDHETMRLKDPTWMESVENLFFEHHTGLKSKQPVLPIEVPLTLRGLRLNNRSVAYFQCALANDYNYHKNKSFDDDRLNVLFNTGLILMVFPNSTDFFASYSSINALLAKSIRHLHENHMANLGLCLNCDKFNDKLVENNALKHEHFSIIQMANKYKLDVLELSYEFTSLSVEGDHLRFDYLLRQLDYFFDFFRKVRHLWQQNRPIFINLKPLDYLNNFSFSANEFMLLIDRFKNNKIDAMAVSAKEINSPLNSLANQCGISTVSIDNCLTVNEINTLIVSNRANLCCLNYSEG